MSRIHDALKKAAEERAAQLAVAPERAIPEIPAEPEHSPNSERNIASLFEETGTPAAITPAGPVGYQELLKRCAQHDWEPDGRSSVFHSSNAGTGGAERFRTLRSRLYQIAATHQLQRLLITSSVAAEGKTFVASNLALSIAQQAERRVLLIDGDLRAPRLHSAFGARKRPGLTDYLKGRIDEFAAIQRGALENLFLISAGQDVSDPSELLLTDRLKHLLNAVSPIFDWIIIDSPPAMPVHDASILADLADGVLLVLRAGLTEAEVAEKITAEFRAKKLLGVVLNRVDKADSYGSYYYAEYGTDNGEAR